MGVEEERMGWEDEGVRSPMDPINITPVPTLGLMPAKFVFMAGLPL